MEKKEALKREDIRNKTFSGFIWQLSQRIVCQVISFAVSVVLSRILLPEEYGIVAIASMLLSLLALFFDSGFGTALVQKKEIDDADSSTVFYIAIGTSITAYVAIFLVSPYLELIFGYPNLKTVIRVLALGMPIGSFSVVRSVILQRRMEFRIIFIRSLIGSVISGVVGIIMALKGFGVWALVGQSMVSTITNNIVLYVSVDWHPKWLFSIERFKTLFSYGWKMTFINILNTFVYQLKGYAIGLKYSAADLAYYNKGEGLPGILYNNINGAINSVLFPALTRLQDDKEAVKSALRRSMRTSSFVLMPALLGLSAVSDKLIIILYTDKWAPAIQFMHVICLIACSDILGMANYLALKATGKMGTLLRIEFIKRPVMLAILMACIYISPLAIAVGQLAYSIFAFLVNAFPNRKYFGYSIKEQLADIGNSFVHSAIMALAVYSVGLIDINIYVNVVVQILLGASLYILLAKRYNREDFNYVMAFAKARVLRMK